MSRLVGLDDRRSLRILDTETTGLLPRRDEVLALSVLDGDGRVLFDQRFGTVRCTRWNTAQAVHGIAPDDVRGLEPLCFYATRVSELLAPATVLVGYNLAFDLAFLAAAGVVVPEEARHFDVMQEFARRHGLRTSRHPHGRWVSLETCAAHYGHEFTAHSSLEDARATLVCYKRLREEAGSDSSW